MSDDNSVPGSNRPSSLELVRAYEERENHPWWDLTLIAAVAYHTGIQALSGNLGLVVLFGSAFCLTLLAFEQSAQNAYEYQHREGW